MHRNIVSQPIRRIIQKQTFFFAIRSLATQKNTDPFIQLSDEHIRIKKTLQSFEKMLNDMKTKADVSTEEANDIKNYIKFVTNYQFHHHIKEEYLYGAFHSREEPNSWSVAMLDAVESEHEHDDDHDHVDVDVDAPGRMMEGGSKTMNKILDLLASKANTINVMSDIVGPSLSFINDTIDHMDEEDKDIYPMIEAILNQNEIEEIRQHFCKYDADKRAVIDEIEILSDQLQQKY